MQILLLRGPLAAQVRLGWTAIRPPAIVEAAPDPVVVQIPAGRDDLGLDGEIARPLHLAEIRRATGTHQGLQLSLPFGAHDLDLKVTAASGTPQIVGRAAGSQGARIPGGEHRQTTRGGWEHANYGLAVLHDQESIAAQTPGLFRLVGVTWGGTAEAIRGAVGTAPIALQVPARDMKHRVHVQLAFILP
jgi:hypothetical protein